MNVEAIAEDTIASHCRMPDGADEDRLENARTSPSSDNQGAPSSDKSEGSTVTDGKARLSDDKSASLNTKATLLNSKSKPLNTTSTPPSNTSPPRPLIDKSPPPPLITMPPPANRPYPKHIYNYTLIIAATSFACGYGVSSMGPAILYIPRSYQLSVMHTTAIFSIILVGALIGTFGSGYLSDAIGRRPVIILSGLVGTVAAAGGAITSSAQQMVIARFVLGLALGAASVLCGLFLAEASPAPIRGRLQGYGNLGGWLGGIFAYLVGVIFIYITPGNLSWRLTLGLNAFLFLFATFATACYLPESPRWLVSKNREHKAYNALAKIYGDDRREELQVEYGNMLQGIYKRHSLEAQKDSFFRAEYRRPLLLTFILNILQQLSGNSMITLYSSIILSSLGFSDLLSVMISGLSIIPQALVIWLIVHHLDKSGRRWPLLISIAGTGISLIILATMICLGSRNHICIWFSLMGIILNRIFFSTGLGPLPAVVGAEVLPYAVRGRGLSAAMGVGEAVKIVTVVLFLPLTKNVHPAFIYGSLAAAMFVGFIYILLQLKETKAKSLDLSIIAQPVQTPPAAERCPS